MVDVEQLESLELPLEFPRLRNILRARLGVRPFADSFSANWVTRSVGMVSVAYDASRVTA